MDQYEQKALDDINETGCHILHVMEEGDYPRFTYSIGIEKTTSQPDLIITGLKQELSIWIINEYNRRIKEGEIFKPTKYYNDFLGEFDVTFVEVKKEHYKEYLGWGLWYNKGDDFKVLQLVYPSTSGIQPWDKEATDDFIWFQPLLNS